MLVIVALQCVTDGWVGCQARKDVLKKKMLSRGNLDPGQNQYLRSDTGRCVEKDVVNRTGTSRDETLMPLVKTRHQRGSQDGDSGPTQSPAFISQGRQRLAPGTEKKNAQQAVTENVAALANVEVPVLELAVVNAEEEVQQGIKKAAGVMRRKISARLNRDNDQPQNGGDPRLENMVAIRAQAGQQSTPSFTEDEVPRG